MTARHVDDAIAALAGPQHGAFSRGQAATCGATESLIERRLDSRTWLWRVDGVYLLPGVPRTWEQDLRVAILAMPHAVLSHATAAALHELEGFRRGPVIATVSHGRTRRKDVATVRQSTDLASAHATVVHSPPESALESLLLRVLRRGGVPRPVLQHPFPGRSPGAARVDAAYPGARVVIEADSRRWHTRVEDFARDRARDNEAVALGWRVLRFTWDDLQRRPDWVCATVRRTVSSEAA